MKKFTFLKGLIVLITVMVMTVNEASSQNLWATSTNGTQISSFTVAAGVWSAGPTNIFAADFTGTTTGATSTAALGRTQQPTQPTGLFYYLGNTASNGGVVEVWGATATGATPTRLGSVDINGAGNPFSLGYVRLGMGPTGLGYILASDGVFAYLATFQANGLALVTINVVDDNVTLVNTALADFLNGDLCVSGNGGLFVLVNNGAGSTHILTGTPNGINTTLTKKWDLVDNANQPFLSTVNGVAFDAVGSLYISTGTGLFYINQNTVNNAGPGTVQCSLVFSVTGLQDLASNFFPNQTTLPVDLVSFSGNMRNNVATLTWETDNEINFDHFEIERSANGSTYSVVGNRPSLHNSIRSTYSFIDNLGSVSGSAFYYRLKMVDIDGKAKYSNVILMRKDQSTIKGITMNPNPVIKGTATVRFTSSADVMVNIRIVDMSGKEMLTQKNKVSEGTNSVSINNLDRLQQGTYLLQMDDGIVVVTTKFSVNR